MLICVQGPHKCLVCRQLIEAVAKEQCVLFTDGTIETWPQWGTFSIKVTEHK